MDEVLSTPEVARILGVSERRCGYLAPKHALGKIGANWMWSRTTVDELKRARDERLKAAG